MENRSIAAVILITITLSSLGTMYVLSILFGSPIKIFYVKRNTSLDTDHDGLVDDFELEIGTNPYSNDTDGDGLCDRDEVLIYNTDPLSTDTDGDGVNDYTEIMVYGTNPLSGDTDNDGLMDGEELELKTDPLDRDTDNDGVQDSLDIDPLINVILVINISLWKEIVSADEDGPGDPVIVIDILTEDGRRVDNRRIELGNDISMYPTPLQSKPIIIEVDIPDNIHKYLLYLEVYDDDGVLRESDKYIIASDGGTTVLIEYNVDSRVRSYVFEGKPVTGMPIGHIELTIYTKK